MNKITEFAAALGVVLALVGVPLVVHGYEKANRSSGYPSDLRSFTLTGVARDGVWTSDEVAGHNYWRRHFPKATIRVEVGERVLLRLKSADVTHSFSCPKLGIEKLEVEPGHVEQVTFNADSPGIYLYYCEAICGDCHYYMRGIIEVVAPAESAKRTTASDLPSCPHDLAPPTQDDPVLQGEYLYLKLGCIACHEGPGAGTGINVPADLRYEGNKVKAEWLPGFLLEPTLLRWREEGVRSSIQMPDFHLSAFQAQNLAAYLMQQTDDELVSPSEIDWDSPASPEEIKEGRQLYKQYQCQGCHQLGGVGREIGPSHDGVGARLRPDYMYRWILEPEKIIPGTSMPNKDLWEDEARALVRFLQTLTKRE